MHHASLKRHLPRISRRLPNRRRRLCEAQNHRCAICAIPIELYAYSDDPRRACLVAMEKGKTKYEDNAIMTCAYCSGAYSNYGSPLDYYEAYVAAGYKHPRKERKPAAQYPETIPEIERFLVEKYRSFDLPPPMDLDIPVHYRETPPHAAEKIAHALFHKQTRGFFALKAQRAIPGSAPVFVMHESHKRMMLESQNHRCCYCSTKMETLLVDDPTYATWEHVVPRRLGGNNGYMNLVMACSLCNNLRDRMDFTAEEFYAWVVEHRSYIENKQNRERKKLRLSNKTPKTRYMVSRLYPQELTDLLEDPSFADTLSFIQGKIKIRETVD